MSITPEGGWNAPREGQIVPSQPDLRTPVITVRHESKSSAFKMGFTGCLVVICAVIFALICLGVLVKVLASAPDQSNGSSAARLYSVTEIDARKNVIKTGTKLSVQGTLYTTKWGPTDDCTRLLMYDHVTVQHGEMDPNEYCRFSILLTEKNKAGGDMWPGAGLECNVTPTEMKVATRQHHYGDRVTVRGVYAPSLDFEIAYLPGFHFGVPVLENCAVDGSADSTAQTQ